MSLGPQLSELARDRGETRVSKTGWGGGKKAKQNRKQNTRLKSRGARVMEEGGGTGSQRRLSVGVSVCWCGLQRFGGGDWQTCHRQHLPDLQCL